MSGRTVKVGEPSTGGGVTQAGSESCSVLGWQSHCELDTSTRDHTHSLFFPARRCLPKRKRRLTLFVFSLGLDLAQQCLCSLSAIQKHGRRGTMSVLSHLSPSPTSARGLVLSLSLLLSISRPTRRSRNAFYSTSHFDHPLRGSGSPHIY